MSVGIYKQSFYLLCVFVMCFCYVFLLCVFVMCFCYYKLFNYYRQTFFRRFKLNAYTNTQKLELKLINNFSNKNGTRRYYFLFCSQSNITIVDTTK